ncbi:type VI immunity family protein [Pseudomonas sp. NPDC089406]|uniref:type VI immunity family protein n=1 Tax=Pseudomonas sp. NPDC089406 TaxID=3364463 RepID=UPI00384AE298
MKPEFNVAEELAKSPHLLEMPGNLLMKGGRQDYVGAVLCLRGTLYFKEAHTSLVREALSQCFDDFKHQAEPHLTWLWREEPPEGKPLTAYDDAKPLREMLASMDEDYPLSFYYTSGKQSNDASPWLFKIVAKAAWEAKIGRDLSILEFSVPLLYQERRPLDFLRLFSSFSRRLSAQQGYAGHAYNLSVTNRDANEPTEAFMAARMPGLDVGTASLLANTPEFKPIRIKTVNWLTVLDHERLTLVGGLEALRAQLPSSHFAFYDYGAGVVIQAGAYPAGGDAEDPRPAAYVLLNHALKGIRYETVGSLHGGSHDGELRLVGWSADQWLKRLDVNEDDLPTWRARLLGSEPGLDVSNTLPERL